MSKGIYDIAVVVDKNYKDSYGLKIVLDVAVLPNPEGVRYLAVGNKSLINDYAKTKKLWNPAPKGTKAECIIIFWDGEDEDTATIYKSAFKGKREFVVFMYKQGEYFDRESVLNGDFKRFFKKHYK